MKFLEFAAPAFGPFTDFRLDLSGEASFHVLFGPNESGKSSTLRALTGLLYGIPHQTDDRFLHDYSKMLLSATIERRDGDRLEFLRRKATRGSLRTPAGTPLDDETLNRFLGSVSKETFERLYGLDHGQLVQGGRELLEGGGEVGHSLFAAGVGPGVLELLARLEKAHQALWTPRSHTRELDKHLRGWREARSARDDLAYRSSDWDELGRQLQEAQRRAAELDEELRRSSEEHARLKRWDAAMGGVGRRTQLLKELAELGSVPELPPGVPARRTELQARKDRLRDGFERATRELGRLQETLGEPSGEGHLLECAADIESLCRGLDGAVNAERLIFENEGERKRSQDRLLDLQTQLGLEGGLEQLSERFPTLSQKQKLRKLAREWLDLKRDLEGHLQRRDETQEQLEQAVEELARLGEEPEYSDLEQAVRLAQSEKHRQTRLQEQQSKLESTEQKVRRASASLPRMGGWDDGELETLKRLKVPTQELLDSVQRRYQDELHAVNTERKLASGLHSQLLEARRTFSETRGDSSPPSRERLQELRSLRHEVWAELLEKWRAGRPLESESTIVDLFELRLRDADETADRILDAAKLAAELEELTRKGTRLKEQFEEQCSSVQQAETRLGEVLQEWQQYWEPEAQLPEAPKDMQSWLRSRAELLADESDREDLRRSTVREAEALAELVDRLDGAARATGHSLGPTGLGFAAALQNAEAILARLSSERQTRERLKHERDRCQRALGKAQERVADLQSQGVHLQTQWTQEAQRLGAVAEEPESCENLLEGFDELAKEWKARETALLHISTQRRVLQEFEERLRRLMSRLEEEGSGRGGVRDAEELQQRLNTAREVEAKRSQLQERAFELEGELQRLRADLIETEKLLAELCREAEVAGLDELLEREQKNEQRREIRAKLAQEELNLRDQSGGQPLETFCSEVAQRDPDGLKGRLAELQPVIEEQQSRSREAHQRLGELRSQRSQLNTDSKAAEKAQEAEEHQAHGLEVVADYMKLRLAHHLLEEQIEEYRRRNQGPVLERAAQLFSRLSCGAYQGLEVAPDRKGSGNALLSVARSGRRVPLSGLSDGTRDQLFLALRLASIELQAQREEPFPLIADDLLINFDTERARAALEVLQELSRTTQVILLTHLCRDRELAEQLDPSLTRIHRLDRFTL